MAKVEEEPEVGSLKVKLPSFWPDKPEAWFVQAESNFKARRITNQQSKFHLVVIALDAETLDGVLDLLEDPPAEDPYDQLKARLVQSFELSKVDKIRRAVECQASDDENPIKLADKMMALSRGASGEDVMKTLFMLKLPDAVRKTMWAEPLVSWPEMKARASKLWHAERTKKREEAFEVTTSAGVGDECGPSRKQGEEEGRQVPRIRCHAFINVREDLVFFTTSSGSPPASARNHVQWRETEGPGGSSGRLGRVPHATRRHVQSIVPGRHRGRGQRRAGIGRGAAASAATKTAGGRQWHKNPMLWGKKIATAGRFPELCMEVLGGRGAEASHRGRLPNANIATR